MAYLPDDELQRQQRLLAGYLGPSSPAGGGGAPAAAAPPPPQTGSPAPTGFGAPFAAEMGFLHQNQPQAGAAGQVLAGQVGADASKASSPAAAHDYATALGSAPGVSAALQHFNGAGYTPGMGTFDAGAMWQSPAARAYFAQVQAQYNGQPPAPGAPPKPPPHQPPDGGPGPKPFGGPKPDPGGANPKGGADPMGDGLSGTGRRSRYPYSGLAGYFRWE